MTLAFFKPKYVRCKRRAIKRVDPGGRADIKERADFSDGFVRHDKPFFAESIRGRIAEIFDCAKHKRATFGRRNLLKLCDT
jgi:hypothetical protein